MRVIGIPVIRRAECDDRLQGAGSAGSNLQRIKAAPRDPEHADGAIAPGLRDKPGDDGERILLFLLGVLVAYQSLGIARAANVDTNTGVAVPGEIMVHGRVAATHEIALA